MSNSYKFLIWYRYVFFGQAPKYVHLIWILVSIHRPLFPDSNDKFLIRASIQYSLNEQMHYTPTSPYLRSYEHRIY